MSTTVPRRRRPLLPALAAALLLSACQTIPDVSGWTQATRDVTGAVTGGFQAAAGVNSDIGRRLQGLPDFAEPAQRYARAAAALEQRADDYEALFGAIADYAGALAALSQASANSAKTVDAVSGALNQLVGAVGGTALAGAGFELGKALASEVIQVKAARDFAEAVERADPVVGRIAALLVADLADLGRTVGDAKPAAVQEAIELPHAKRLEFRAALERRRSSLQAAVRTALAQPARSLVDVADASELRQVEQLLRETDSWYQPMQAELQQALKQRETTQALTVQASRAVQAWRASHASVAAAVRERRPPESGRLAALALRIRALSDELKKEK
ncbi:MAG: hypothetical protein V4795_05170 [Pseudomonadota bacterium]